MPKRQKMLLIVLAVVLAYAAYEYLPGDESGNTSVSEGFVSGRPATSQNLAQPEIRDQGQLTQAGQGTRTFQPPPNLELRDDPFSRPPSLKPVSDTQTQPSQLTGIRFQGTFGKMAVINDRPYEVNDIIMGFTIIEYTSERVVFSDTEGKRHVLRKN